MHSAHGITWKPLVGLSTCQHLMRQVMLQGCCQGTREDGVTNVEDACASEQSLRQYQSGVHQ